MRACRHVPFEDLGAFVFHHAQRDDRIIASPGRPYIISLAASTHDTVDPEGVLRRRITFYALLGQDYRSRVGAITMANIALLETFLLSSDT